MSSREREERAREIWIDERPYTVHVEPPEQGSEKYARCVGCGQEIVPVGRFEYLSHSDNCPVAATDGGTDR